MATTDLAVLIAGFDLPETVPPPFVPIAAAELPADDVLELDMLLAGDGAPAEPRLPFPDWLDVEAQALRIRGGAAAVWLAGQVEQLAAQARSLQARTPDQFDARHEVMAHDADYSTWERARRQGYQEACGDYGIDLWS